MKQLIMLFSFTFLFASCEKLDVPKGTPSCIKKQIREAKSNEHSCNDEVYRYDYRGETVYLFTDDGNCNDAYSTVYNENCEVLCTMGGLSGHGDGRCPDFDQQATNEVLIWSR